MTQDHYLSKEKFKELEGELQHLKTVRRKEIAESLEYAKSLGDLSENAEYQEARESQAKTEDRIMVLENLLKSALIVDEQRHSATADLGSTLTIQKKGEKGTIKYIIVGSEEADMKQSKISNESPLGSALLGKKKGDTVTVRTPRGEQQYTIIEIA